MVLEHFHNYFCYKQFYPLSVQALCDYKDAFIDVECKRPSSVHDAKAFANSSISKRLRSSDLPTIFQTLSCIILERHSVYFKEELVKALLELQQTNEIQFKNLAELMFPCVEGEEKLFTCFVSNRFVSNWRLEVKESNNFKTQSFCKMVMNENQ